MAGGVHWVHHDQRGGAYYRLRSAPGVRAFVTAEAHKVAAIANAELGEDGFGVGSRQGRIQKQGRWRATVFARTTHAQRHNRKHNTLLRALRVRIR